MCDRMCEGCPFDFGTEQTEIIQNYGCLPTPYEIRNMRVHHGKTWACHSDPAMPCVGAIHWLSEKGEPFKVINRELLGESSPWHLYVQPTTAATHHRRHPPGAAGMTMTLIKQLRGRAAFLRDKGRIKSPQLMEQAADALEAHLSQPAQAVDVDSLSQEIRRIDGSHSLGAGALAEALMPFLTRALSTAQAEGRGVDGVEALLTAAMREADATFDRVGGGTRHYVRDCLLPILEKHGLLLSVTHPVSSERGRK